MFKRFFAPASVLALTAVCLTGCVCKVNLSEALQQPLNSKVRTAYHIWYTDSQNISALNYMEGKFIPAGTVIEPITIERGSYDIWGTVSVVDGSIKFKTLDDNKEYIIKYDEHLTMLPIEDFLRQIFTVKSLEDIYKNVPADELARVKAGKLESKMTKASVLIILGPPAKSRTSSMNNQSWLYWKNRDQVFRLLFRGERIRLIGSLDDMKF